MALLATLKCSQCGREFESDIAALVQRGMTNVPRHCPACNDERQGRPEIVVDTVQLAFYPRVKIMSLPPKPWERRKHRAQDVEDWVLDFKGEDLRDGAAWEGRIVLRAPVPAFPDSPPEAGCVVSLSEMESRVKVAVVEGYRDVSVAAGIPGMTRPWREKVPVYYSDQRGEALARKKNGTFRRVEETRRYIVVGKPDLSVGEELLAVYLAARSKTTLKGLGRQYHAALALDGTVAHWDVYASARSGRFGTHAAWALVDERDAEFIGVRHTEDGHEEFSPVMPAEDIINEY